MILEIDTSTPELKWLAACDRLGKWTSALASIVQRLNGRWWRWTWEYSASKLWALSSKQWEATPGRDHFLAAWKALVDAGLLVFIDGKGWVASCSAFVLRPKRKASNKATGLCTSSPPRNRDPENRAPLDAIYERVGVRADHVLHPPEPTPAIDLPPPPYQRSTTPMASNDRPLHHLLRRIHGAGATPTATGEPKHLEPKPASVEAPSGLPRRGDRFDPEALARLRQEHYGIPPEAKRTPAPAAPPPKPAPADHASTEAVFWSQRYPKLCDLAERLWGQRGRANVESYTGAHHELLSWSLRATDRVWDDALVAMERAKADELPGIVAKYLSSILSRSVPAAEKARRGDGPSINAPIQPTRDALPGERLARLLNMCNRLDAHGQGLPTTGGAHRQSDGAEHGRLGGDRDDREPLAVGSYRGRAS